MPDRLYTDAMTKIKEQLQLLEDVAETYAQGAGWQEVELVSAELYALTTRVLTITDAPLRAPAPYRMELPVIQTTGEHGLTWREIKRTVEMAGVRDDTEFTTIELQVDETADDPPPVVYDAERNLARWDNVSEYRS